MRQSFNSSSGRSVGRHKWETITIALSSAGYSERGVLYRHRDIAIAHSLDNDWSRSRKSIERGHAHSFRGALDSEQMREALAPEMKDGPWILL